MRVVIDARELCGRPTGVGRYLAGLLDAWATSDRALRYEWILVAHAALPPAPQWPVSVRVLHGGGGTSWEQLTLPRAVSSEHPDVFFAPGYTAPLTVTASLVQTIHDVSFFAHPEWFSFREGARRRLLTSWSARRARAVITDSQFSRDEIQRHVGIPAGRIRVIPLGISDPGRPVPDPGERREPTVLFVGSVFARRRVERLISSFDRVVAKVPHARLEIVGENRTPRLDLDTLRRRSTHPDRITIRSYVDDATLGDLYRRASVFAFLSEYEGFGLTPLEALSHGLPPLLLDTAIARETCGEAAAYVAEDATDDEIGAVIVALLTDGRTRRAILANAADVLRRYNWSRAAADTLSVLEEAARGR
jgi:glycosyltransferase involved in cell wall biosynthesis